MAKEKLPTIEMKNFGDFAKKYVKALTDTMVIDMGEEGKIAELSFNPTKELQKICGIEEQPNDPYDDFEHYIDYGFCLENNVVTLVCGDNFETKEFKLVGDTRTIKGMLKEILNK